MREDGAQEERALKKVFTIPNVLTSIRILLIPIFVIVYLRGNYVWSLVIVALSALSDMMDGLIARKYHMVSDVGKALDPIADKLSQIALMFCLVFRFPHMIFPLALIAVKELTSGILVLVTINKTHKMESAVWHGKLSTVLLYSMMILHVLWFNIPPLVSDITIAVCVVMMLVSFTLYTVRFIKELKNNKKDGSPKEVEAEDPEEGASLPNGK